MLGSTIPISILGTRYAMAVNPFWTPAQYSASYVVPNSTFFDPKFLVPIVGMLCGATISGITVSTNYILKELM